VVSFLSRIVAGSNLLISGSNLLNLIAAAGLNLILQDQVLAGSSTLIPAAGSKILIAASGGILILLQQSRIESISSSRIEYYSSRIEYNNNNSSSKIATAEQDRIY
jgi:hypothetical protein